jgi:hypothetical protein
MEQKEIKKMDERKTKTTTARTRTKIHYGENTKIFSSFCAQVILSIFF